MRTATACHAKNTEEDTACGHTLCIYLPNAATNSSDNAPTVGGRRSEGSLYRENKLQRLRFIYFFAKDDVRTGFYKSVKTSGLETERMLIINSKGLLMRTLDVYVCVTAVARSAVYQQLSEGCGSL